MKKRTKYKIKCFMLVVMVAVLALLPHISSAMEQDISEVLDMVTYVDNAEERPISGTDTNLKAIGQEERVFELSNARYEVLPLKVKEEMKEGEKVLYACVAVAGPGLLLLGTSLYKKRKVENINYW